MAFRITLPSGAHLALVVSRFSPPLDEWSASLSLSVKFEASDPYEAQEKAIATISAILDHAVHDLAAM